MAKDQIEEFMKNENLYDVRLSCQGRWMYFDQTAKCWVVRQHKPYAKKSTIVIETVNLLLALLKLSEEG